MPRSVEASLFAALKEIQRVAGRPIAGGSVPPSLEWSAQSIYEAVANWSPGGDIPDPLELGAAVFADYVAAGTGLFGGPAQNGAVRVPYGNGLWARNEADDGDVRLIALEDNINRVQGTGATGRVDILPDLNGDSKIEIRADGHMAVVDADGNAWLDYSSGYITLGVGLTVVPSGHLLIQKFAAPADGDINNGNVSLWFDRTNGASKLMIKGKSQNGTVVSGEVALT